MAIAQVTPIGVGIHNVLIATDFSRYSGTALEFGLQLAKEYRACAYIVFVVPNDAFLLAGPKVFVAARDAGHRDLEALEAELLVTHPPSAGENYHLFLLEGDVAQSILNFAQQKQIDLIVLGTHGRGGVPKALLGSVAERIFRHSPVPVLTLGPCIRSAHQGDPQQILVAADFTPASQRAIRYALGLAHEHSSRLTLLHVVTPAQMRKLADPAALARGLELRLKGFLGREGEELSYSLRIEVGPITDTILNCAKTISADLLVMGVRASSGVLDRLVIPHAYDVLRHASCPVLTLRDSTSTFHRN